MFIRKYFFGLELVLICTVTTSVTLGSKIGAFMGVILMVVNYLAERRVSDYFIITLTLYSIIGYISYNFRSYDIVTLGVIIAIIYNFFSFVFSKIIGANTVTLIVFNIINIGWNMFLFFIYGDLFVGFLS